jgi:hypothetical protein
LEKERRVVAVPANDRLVDPGLAQLLHQAADVVRPRRNVQHVGRRRKRQDPRNLIGEIDRAAGVDVVPDDDAAELGVALAELRASSSV